VNQKTATSVLHATGKTKLNPKVENIKLLRGKDEAGEDSNKDEKLLFNIANFISKTSATSRT